MLTTDMFYEARHQVIHKTILEIAKEGITPDILSVSHRIKVYDDSITAYDIVKITESIIELTNYHTYVVWATALRRKMIIYLLEKAKYLASDLCNQDDALLILDQTATELSTLIGDRPLGDYKSASQVSDGLIKMVEDYDSGKITDLKQFKIFQTGFSNFDENVSIMANRIITIAGYPSHGKSKFIQKCMFNLLDLYKDEIAIQWISTEETPEEIQMCFASSEILEKPKNIQIMNIPIAKRSKLIEAFRRFKKYDVRTCNKIAQITKIANEFRTFVKFRPDKFNILVIDNILTLEESKGKFDQDDLIWKEIVRLKQDTNHLGNACIIAIHHYRKEPDSPQEVKATAGRPEQNSIKGSEACIRASNQVLLLNNIKMRKSMFSEYSKREQEILNHLIVIDPGKNRNDENGEDQLLRYFVDLNFNLWKEL